MTPSSLRQSSHNKLQPQRPKITFPTCIASRSISTALGVRMMGSSALWTGAALRDSQRSTTYRIDDERLCAPLRLHDHVVRHLQRFLKRRRLLRVDDELGRVALDDGRRVVRREDVREHGNGGVKGRARVLHRSSDHTETAAVALRRMGYTVFIRYHVVHDTKVLGYGNYPTIDYLPEGGGQLGQQASHRFHRGCK
ncbi:hypothetical protein PRIPAC_92841 [Pristionchus pacificus]|uniref:Uncharacterized protein n=1 Tax=Pristionchus pacificus TaxID=54126 RepID=A0A2A6CDT0_PRIPA|nr:hypothetical protein PRIPAC_92841 [Pristionchus pacificus]|eukprot:PDM76269.1 hypothetical protein PRIPAC_39873 [Pristionchus pacificus]